MDVRAPTIEIEVKGNPDQDYRVPLRTFARAAENLTDLLVQIASDNTEPVRVDWFVRTLRTGSAIAEIEGLAADQEAEERELVVAESAARDVVRQTMEAIYALEHGGDVRNLLSFPAIERVRSLTALVREGEGGIVIRTSEQEISLTLVGAWRAKSLLEQKYRSYGSVEGVIETLSVHEKRPYFNVFHVLDGYAIKCRSDLDMLSEANASLGSRVRVTGEIQRRYDGRAESVEVASVSRLRDRDTLPQASELRGILQREEGDDSLPRTGSFTDG